jgi:glycosyltransferase involved in cell wall biosynthesis
MKIAHVVIVSPRQCGLYETVREVVAAERALGHDARMFDPAPTKYHPQGDEDRGAGIVRDKAWLAEADIIADHSGCDGTTDTLSTPHILVAHGRPRHSFLSEVNGGPPIYSYHYRLDQTPKYKAVVTFWPEHVHYLKVMFRQTPVHYVPACVDQKAWSPEGPSGYSFHGKGGAFNVVCADAWRDDCDPFDAFNAVALAARQMPGIKLHVYGKRGVGEKGWGALLKVLSEDGTLGEVCGWVDGLAHVYRAADLVVTCNQIATRAMREAMACGCPVQVVRGADPQPILCALTNPRRVTAERFDPLVTARSFLAIAEKCL